MTDRQCPRCGENLPPPRWTGRGGRPPIWCSQRCRRAAYEERRAATNGAIAVRVEVIEKPVERIIERVRVEKQIEIRPQKVPAAEAAQIVLRSPRACATVLEALADENLANPTLDFWNYGYGRRAAALLAAAAARRGVSTPLPRYRGTYLQRLDEARANLRDRLPPDP
jgi:hypothetical protein